MQAIKWMFFSERSVNTAQQSALYS